MKRNNDLPSAPLTPSPPRDAVFDAELGAWVLSQYADVLAAFREPALWPVSAHGKKTVKIPDVDAQRLLRARILDAFSSSRLNEWQKRMERAAGMLVFGSPVDLVSEFAETWCLAAAEIVTGSDSADRPRLLAAARVVSAASAEPLDEHLHCAASLASAELEHYFADRQPETSAIPMAAPTFVALSRTLACLLANAWLALLHHPAELACLRACPEQIPKAIEEILRYACLPQSLFRYASRPVVLCGLRIAEGDRVILRVASANRDPQQFPDPDRIDFSRRGPAHLSLGFGPHSCAGAALIRTSAKVATRLFVKKFADSAICRAVEWQGGTGFRYPARLVVRQPPIGNRDNTFTSSLQPLGPRSV